MKRCTKCSETKALAEFTPNKRASLGVNNWCKVCYNAYSAEYYQKTRSVRLVQQKEGRKRLAPEERARRGKAWRDANPEYFQKRYAENRDSVRAYGKKRYWADRERQIAEAVQWAKDNPEKARANNARRLARKSIAGGRGVTGDEWKDIVSSTAGLCTYCSRKRPLALDHIEPLARGGMHDPDNLTPACKSCNCSKKAKPLLVWLAERAA